MWKALLLCLLVSVRAVAQEPEREALILQVRLKQLILSEGIASYIGAKPGVFLLPLNQLCQLLQFGVDVKVSEGKASGFFVSQDRTFFLDMAMGKVYSEGKEKLFDSTQIEIHKDDIYVSADLLSTWFPAIFSVSTGELVLRIKSSEELPIEKQIKLEQEAKRNRNRLGIEAPTYPKLNIPYEMISFPIVDATVKLNFNSNATNRNTSLESSALVSGDLLYHSFMGFLSVTNEGIQSKYFSMGKQDIDGDLLGPMKATSYIAGTVEYSGLDSISRARNGNGALLTNMPLNQTNRNMQSFSGPLPDGYRVELYQNGSLIGYQTGTNGRYEFANVPVYYGANIYKLIFYGPQNQQYQETHSFNLNDTLTPSGRFWYQATGVNGDYGREHLWLSYGVARNISLDASIADVILSDQQSHKYASLGIRGLWSGIYYKLESVASNNSSLITGTLQGMVGPVALSLSHSELQNGFVSEVYWPSQSSIVSRNVVRLNTFIPGVIPFTLSGSFQQDKLADGGYTLLATERISATYKHYFVTNILTQQNGFDSGTFLLSRHMNGWDVNSEIDYNIKPQTNISVVSLGMNRYLGQNTVSGGILENTSNKTTHLLAGFMRNTKKKYSCGINLDYAGAKNSSVSLTFNTSFARDPVTGKLLTFGRPTASSGAVVPHAELAGKGMAGIGFVGKEETTNSDGITFLTVPANQHTNLLLDTGTIADPSVTAEKPAVTVTGRAGRIGIWETKLVSTGDMTGYVSGPNKEPLAGVTLEVVGENKTYTVTSAYDSFFYLGGIIPGRYKLQLSKSDLERLNVKQISQEVIITPEGNADLSIRLENVK